MAEVLREFGDNTQRLKQLLEETRQIFQDIQSKSPNLERQDSKWKLSWLHVKLLIQKKKILVL